jgi:acid phosphatase
MKAGRGLIATLLAGALLALPILGAADAATTQSGGHRPPRFPGGFKHLVVIYQENHSFDNLYGRWGRVGGQKVNGLRKASPATWTQRAQDGSAYTCLLQNDPSLTTPPLGGECQDSHTVYDPATGLPSSSGFASHFANRPFKIDRYLAPDAVTCPNPAPAPAQPPLLPGGCTRDLVHRFYQEQYQLHGGAQDRYVTGSDAVGLAMGVYATRRLPIYRYLHSRGAPKYVVADNFFQAAFGGSFLNHQWLIAARTPLDTGGATPKALNSLVDANGMPIAYPLYQPPAGSVVRDAPLTVECPGTTANDYEAACGDYAVNTTQPSSPPARADAASKIPLIDDDVYPNIGDRLSDAGISWAWYAGKWDAVQEDAAAAPLFQHHHQPFNYFEDYAPGEPGRAHLQDETDFEAAVANGTLPRVSFVKPYGSENEHPGYASEQDGSTHLVDLVRQITEGPQARRTLVVVTYDEFGGQWDHVPPPGMAGTPGVHDSWGPGTRVPALVIARSLRRSGVDHTTYDTTSILATIERSLGLAPLSSRDAAVNDLSNAVEVGGR